MATFGRVSLLFVLVLLFSLETSAQILYGHQGCNTQLRNLGWQPTQWKKWSEKINGANLNQPLTIECGEAVIVDTAVDVNLKGGLRVEGLLYIPTNVADVSIKTINVLVTGYLKIGTARQQLRGMKNVEIILENGDDVVRNLRANMKAANRVGGQAGEPNTDGNFGDRAFVVFGGQVEMYGLSRFNAENVHTLLLETVNPGEKTLRLHGKLAWPEGMKIVLAPSGYEHTETEYLTIAKRRISGPETIIEVVEPLRYKHYGKDETFYVRSHKVEMAAEVILVERKVRIVSRHEGPGSLKGGHFMVTNTALKQVIQGVEFKGMGQQGTMGRYPIHFHMCGVTDDSMVRGCSVHESFQRAIVVHGTRSMNVYDNTLYNIQGHGILAGEDGWEEDNEFIRNVGILFQRIQRKNLLPDSTDTQVAGIWITNPFNTFEGNRMSASVHTGIWFEMRETVFGASRNIVGANRVRPKYMATRHFRNHVAHSNRLFGVRLYVERWVPEERNHLDGILTYKNLGKGLHLHDGKSADISNLIMVDNMECGIDRGGHVSLVRDSLIIGKSHLGGVCPTGHGIVFNARRLDRLSPCWFDNLIVTGFRGCPKSAVGFDAENVLTVEDPLSTAVGFYNSAFLDLSPGEAFSLMEPIRSGREFSKFIALAIRNTQFLTTRLSQAFVVPNSKFMSPRGASCSAVDQGKICSGVCLRTMEVQIKNRFTPGARYLMKVTRVRDGEEIIARPLGTQNARGPWKFYFTAQTDEEYDVQLVIPKGANVPEQLWIGPGDADRPCMQGDIKLNVIQDSFSLEDPQGFTGATERYDTCKGPKPAISTFKDVCESSKQKRKFVIPPGALGYDLHWTDRSISMKMNEGRPACRTDSIC